MKKVYDLIGIGIGPYNMGLAALLEKTKIDSIFFDKTEKFEWHPGMLIEGTSLQVPFLADLVSFADPTSRYTYLNYLHEQNRLYQFYFFKKFEVPREEYNDYLQWAAAKMDNLHFGYSVIDVLDHSESEEPLFEVVTEDVKTGKQVHYLAKNIVMGTGSEPVIPKGMGGHPSKDVIHTSRYMYEKHSLLDSDVVTVVGSGQSAAEVFLDLLNEQDKHSFELTLLTRSAGLFQLDEAKLGQEYFSPDYVDYYHSLPFEQRINALDTLGNLRKGIDPDTLTAIYDKLYYKSAGGRKLDITIQPLTSVESVKSYGGKYVLECNQWQEEHSFEHTTDKVILATGYKPHLPEWFMDRFAGKIEWEKDKLFKVTRDYQLSFKEERKHKFFTLTNLEHTHGAGATNLGLSVQRNIHIVNLLANEQVYANKRNTIFQQFSVREK
ncbi:lysine N(6)-hydroxylase/L-ornithine N(5)-oxygenase family protein [Sediminibacillus massiliensis]|uniref:lysine N(6)-hydroxylase/L-ornithine N(5)-oxygenase family protein n=1 Tax=Sediminibacillus massiliensis TaxID=1926277 RepID=UPI0009889429|nr:SidA/IucD/PvdA family monooxygenase [Sediminibacillus massiliensis]